MISQKRPLAILLVCLTVTACSAARYLKGGIYKNLNENLTIVGLTENPNKFLDKTIVISVRYYKKGDLPC
ncbi:MAG: hypothetical protein WBG50_09720, partial [Desulfomonilaceae bacterium]